MAKIPKWTTKSTNRLPWLGLENSDVGLFKVAHDARSPLFKWCVYALIITHYNQIRNENPYSNLPTLYRSPLHEYIDEPNSLQVINDCLQFFTLITKLFEF